MKEIVFVSGKGGTGKTSLMAAFASLAAKPVLADCDVDAADLFLLLEPVTLETYLFVGGKQAWIDETLCKREGICQQNCRFQAVQREKDGRYVIDPLRCEGCGVCAYFCMYGAIRLEPVQDGEWFVSQTRLGRMVHARLTPGHANSGKLVTEVRRKAQRIGQEEGTDQLLVDGPPGVGCPAIASLVGADLALLVTEPTVAATHDLQRLLDLIWQLRVRPAILVNKWTINPVLTKELEALAEHWKVPVVGRIPYDSVFNRAQRAGKTLLEYDGSLTEEIRQAWSRILVEVK
jgi:MinD superfamily P-loop ATPase